MKQEKLIIKLLSGVVDKNFNFKDLVAILESLNFILRNKKGSHHIFTRDTVAEIINIQPNDGKAKPYQMKQVREIIIK